MTDMGDYAQGTGVFEQNAERVTWTQAEINVLFGKPADADPELYDLPRAEDWNALQGRITSNRDRAVDLKGQAHTERSE